MKLAILSDIHANLPALDAVLRDLDRERADLIINLGDSVGIGPFPAETLHRLLSLPNALHVQGNHDDYHARGATSSHSPMSGSERAHHQWVQAQLNRVHLSHLATWPRHRRLTPHNLPLLFVHYAHQPDNDFAPIVKDPTPTSLDATFAHDRATHAPVSLIFHGHHHTPCDIQSQSRYINPGSLGCTREDVARWIVLEVAHDASYTLHPRTTTYDRPQTLRALEDRNVPDRDLIASAFFGM